MSDARPVAALKCFNALFGWASLSDILTNELLHNICFVYLVDPKTHQSALNCLETIFTKRTDASLVFKQHSYILIHALSTLKDPVNQELPITNNKHVLEFLTTFLSKFSALIDIILFPAPSGASEKDIEHIDEDVSQFLSGLEAYEVTKDDFAQEILTLYRVVLSTNIDNINSSFWCMWCNIVRKIYFEMVQTPEMRPIFEFFEEIFPYMREKLFKLLPSAADNDGIVSFDARSCWSIMLQLDPEEMTNFIKDQDPSVELCYSIGCLEFSFVNEELYAPILELLPELIDNFEELEDPSKEYIDSLIFAASHCTNYLLQDRDIFVKVILFIISCLQNNIENAPAASLALLNLVNKIIDPFLDEDMEVAKHVIENGETFMTSLDRDSMIRLFKISIKLISKCSDENTINESLNSLLSPCNDSIQCFSEDQVNRESIDGCINALDIITECANSIDGFYDIIPSLFLDQLMETCEITIGEENLGDVTGSLLIALGTILSFMNWEDIKEIFVTICTMIVDKSEDFSLVFPFIKIIRSRIVEVEEEFESIVESLIQPVIDLDYVPYESLLSMISEFSLNVITPEFVIPLISNGLNDNKRECNEAAVMCYKALIKSEGENTQEFFTNTYGDVLGACFGNILSLIHNESYECITLLIRFIFNIASDYGILSNDEFGGCCVDIISSYVSEEPHEGFFVEFIEYLKSIRASQIKFISAMNDFLTNLNKISPVDVDAFKIKDYVFPYITDRSKYGQVFGSDIHEKSLITTLSINSIKKLLKR